MTLVLVIACDRGDDVVIEVPPVPEEPKYQAFPTENAFWTMSRCEFGFFRKAGIVKIGIFGDTIINNKTYHKWYGQSKFERETHCNNCDFQLDREDAFYFTSFREENKKIYIVPRVPAAGDPQGSEYVIYDFNISKAGDKVSVYPIFFTPYTDDPLEWGGFLGRDVPVTYTVLKIADVKMSDGSMRKVYIFEDAMAEAWIEGIGTTNGFSSFSHIFDITDVTLCFSANGVHLPDLSLVVLETQACDVTPVTFELTQKK